MSSSGKTPTKTFSGGWYSAFDVLRTLQPQTTNSLATTFPGFQNEILGIRKFGPGSLYNTAELSRRAELSRAAVEAVLLAVTAALEEVLAVVKSRARILARTRFGSALVSLAGSSGVIAAISRNSKETITLASAAVAFVAAALTLLVTFYEDQSGGDGSVARLREDMINEVGALAVVRGKMALGLVTLQDESLISVMEALNAISAKVMVARARLGLRIVTAANR